MQDTLIVFAREHLLPLAITVGWYILAGVIAALFAKKTRIDAWCAANPKLAFVLNILRASGFDVWKVIAASQNLARSKAGLPPIVPAITLLVGLSLIQPGCSLETARQTRINSQLQAERAGRMAATRPESECKTWDTIHVWGDWTAGGLASVSAGAAALAVGSENEKVDKAAQWVGLGSGVASAIVLGIATKSAETWQEHCQ